MTGPISQDTSLGRCFNNDPELIPVVEHALVKSSEAIIEPETMGYAFQTETTIADWHYKAGQRYMDAKRFVSLLMQNVCRNGAMLLNLTQHGRGNLDPEVIQIDGQTRSTADLSTSSARQAQQTAREIAGLTPGNHSIAIINRGPGPVAMDALNIR